MSVFKKLRKEKGLTQTELASILNIDQTTVSKWELGKALPETTMLIKLSEFYDVSSDYLLGKSTYYYPDNVKNRILDDATDFIQASPIEKQLLFDFRKLVPEMQNYVTGIVHNLAGNT